ncbi:diguanylate cyclase [Aquipuribacter sp. SD81]|uniref:diguanylate cyclase n=1 Tax=Aquipuribacter sp. SD81 TaxID=3127703 RepID=UPI003019CE2B
MRVALVANGLGDYVVRIAAGMSEVIGTAGGSVLVVVLPPVPVTRGRWLARVVAGGAVDAVALTSVMDPVSGEACVADLLEQAAGVPLVTLGVAHPAVPDVSCDNAAGASAAARHLLGLGRRRPLLVAGMADSTDSTVREAAFLATCEQLGVPGGEVRLLRAGYSRELAYRRTTALLREDAVGGTRAPDCVFAVNDEMAMGVVDALTVHGLRVPDDVAVVGFDATEAAVAVEPGLTSLDQDLLEQGRCAARILLARLRGGRVPRRVRTRARLVVRGSTDPAAAREDPGPAVPAGPAGTTARNHELLLLHPGLLSASSAPDLRAELAALLPRTPLRRVLLSRARDGEGELVHGHGVDVDVSPVPRFALERLVPTCVETQLDHGLLVVHLLTDGDRETGVLVHEHDAAHRLSGEALHRVLTAALARLVRAEQLQEHAAALEELVTSRTAELREANERLRAALLVDGLTGLQNRGSFDAALQAAWDEHERTGQPLSVLMCDVDHFKVYNDVLGHLAGDRCLRAVAGSVAEAVRGGRDLVARFGGEEFVVLLPGADAEAADKVARRVLRRLRAAGLPHPGAASGRVSVSIGHATSARPDVLGEPAVLVGRADQALYRAKTLGRDRSAGWVDAGTPSVTASP